MGNNHDKYFGKDKRKILVLGLPDIGKTTLVENIVQGKSANLKVQKTKDLNIRDVNLQGLNTTIFDLAGGQRQRVFWKQHYEGAQGIIFLIDCLANEEDIETSLGQLSKINKAECLLGIPLAICLNKSDLGRDQEIKILEKRIYDSTKSFKLKSKVFITNMNNPAKTKEMMTWLMKQTKPL